MAAKHAKGECRGHRRPKSPWSPNARPKEVKPTRSAEHPNPARAETSTGRAGSPTELLRTPKARRSSKEAKARPGEGKSSVGDRRERSVLWALLPDSEPEDSITPDSTMPILRWHP